jgi:hypothetical protein
MQISVYLTVAATVFAVLLTVAVQVNTSAISVAMNALQGCSTFGLSCILRRDAPYPIG